MFNIMPWKRKSDKEMVSFKKDLDDLFDRFFGEFPAMKMEGFGDRGFYPRIDLSETKDKVSVKVELPGMDAKEINVSVHGNILSIQGEKKREKEDNEENFHRVERCYGSFRRDVELPAEIDEDKIEARHKNGVLVIDMPKSKKAQKQIHTVEVK